MTNWVNEYADAAFRNLKRSDNSISKQLDSDLVDVREFLKELLNDAVVNNPLEEQQQIMRRVIRSVRRFANFTETDNNERPVISRNEITTLLQEYMYV